MPDQAGRESVRLVLDLDLTAGGPSGRLVDEQGSVRAFFGWLQLMDGLDGARRRAAKTKLPDGSRGGDAPTEEERGELLE
jgi:hypothetical protein